MIQLKLEKLSLTELISVYEFISKPFNLNNSNLFKSTEESEDIIKHLNNYDSQKIKLDTINIICKREEEVSEMIKDHVTQLKISDKKEQDHIFEKLEFIQLVLSTAIWKYEISLSNELKTFVKDFDRIDDPRERVRILSEL